MSEEQQPTSMTTFSPISKALQNVLGSELTQTQENSSTTGKELVSQCVTGKLPSETTLDGLRDIARSVSKGHLMDDNALVTLLVQHFGPQRFSAKEKIKHIYGPNGYDCECEGWVVTLDGLGNNEMKLFDAVDFLNKPANVGFVAGKMAQLRAVMARANESQNDIQLVISTYAEHLERFPSDIVAYVIDETIATKKWFPQVCELVSKCEKLTKLRKEIMRKFESARSVVAIGFNTTGASPLC